MLSDTHKKKALPLISLIKNKLSLPFPVQPSGIHWEILDPQKHLPFLFEWVQLPYAKQYWQMDHLSYDEFVEHYSQVLELNYGTSLVGYFEGKAVCQVEVYECKHDEISRYYDAQDGDIGIHFLMAPMNGKKIDQLSPTMMKSVLALLFSSEMVERIMGEPDTENQKANALVQKAGFRFVKKITMSYKNANLYCCTPNSFRSNN